MTINLATGDTNILTSPNWPNNYPNNQDCRWNIVNTSGNNIKTEVKKVNIENSTGCKKDMLVFNPVKKHTKVKLCGTSVASNKVTTTSDGPNLTVKFVSNGKTRKQGFKLLLTGK